jgi:hypothetical protein
MYILQTKTIPERAFSIVFVLHKIVKNYIIIAGIFVLINGNFF